MTMTRRRVNRTTFSAATFLLLALCLGRPAEVRAQWSTDTNTHTTTTSDKVGVGTTSPQTQLDVTGSGLAVRTTFGGTTGAHGKFQIYSRDIANNPFGEMQMYAPSGAGSEYLRFNIANSNGAVYPDVLTISRTGNVGIGTTSPLNALHVYNALGSQAVRVSGGGGAFINFQDATAGANQRLYQWRSEGGVFRMSLVNDAENAFVQQNILVANSSGSVGIGTASPSSIFSVNLNNSDYTNTGGAGSHFVMTNPNATGQNVVTSIINGVTVAKWRTDYVGNVSWVAGANGKHDFYTGGDFPTGTVRMTILNNGNVGIGQSNPQKRLDVGGDINASGTITGGSINARYQDVAEWVPSEQKLQAGTVVVLDSERTNHVLASTASYDTKVAGVISERPGISLGEGGEGKVLVATTGRVKVKVDATLAPIKVGDLLVSSDTEGVAMKSEPIMVGGRKLHAPGTIIGKALEPLEKGVGEILILLSLQ